MIVVTGGAGFIGSALVWALNRRGIDDILVVDRLRETEKWKNLVPLSFSDYLDKSEFIRQLEENAFGNTLRAIFHLGACSSTTERDADYLMENNTRYTARIASWQSAHRECRFVYASSAATYGAGENGYADREDRLHRLRPLNMYGYSKHLFDLMALRNGWLSHAVGLKYFNVFGPNESHKGDMRSVIHKTFPSVRDEGRIRLFQSYRDDYGHGDQKRDFIYVKDAVEITLFFLDHPEINGIFNVGTSVARSWNDVARAMFEALGKPAVIDYIPMPAPLQGKYQYYTCADMTKLRAAGLTHACADLKEAVTDYIQNYLIPDRYLENPPPRPES